ncbi:MAG: hypothetical protein IJM37_07050 [Lachnospiraceae bacterium]|nr:hypothetical protein [Lachnospiraceae bacterium]
MYGLKNMLIQEQKHLNDIICRAKEDIKNCPEGYLRISKDKEKTRFYHCINDRNGIYIPKKDEQLPKQLAQKTYNCTVIKKAETRLKQITKLLQNYSDDEIEQIYQSSCVERQALITPIEPTIEQEVKQWLEQPYEGKGFQEGTAEIFTDKGERVRSKSEKILADYFYRNDIPYLYERPLYLNGYGTVYPDFTFYSKRMKQEIYWEHEGMMDNQEYARSAIKKINLYQMNGIFPGERLILTFETEMDILNSKIINALVEKYLINV